MRVILINFFTTLIVLGAIVFPAFAKTSGRHTYFGNEFMKVEKTRIDFLQLNLNKHVSTCLLGTTCQLNEK